MRKKKIEPCLGKKMPEVAMAGVCAIIMKALIDKNCSLFLMLQEIRGKKKKKNH